MQTRDVLGALMLWPDLFFEIPKHLRMVTEVFTCDEAAVLAAIARCHRNGLEPNFLNVNKTLGAWASDVSPAFIASLTDGVRKRPTRDDLIEFFGPQLTH